MTFFEEVRLITLRLREEIFSSKLKKENKVNATVNNSRGIINLKQKKSRETTDSNMKLWFDFDTEKSREKINCDKSQFESFIEDTKKCQNIEGFLNLKTLKKVSKHWGILGFEDLTKNRQNEFDKIKFINDENQTHQSQASKTEALQVNNFQSVTFVYWPFFQRIWTKILHDIKTK